MRQASNIHDLANNCNPQLNLKKFYTKLRFDKQYPSVEYYANLFVVASILKKCYDEVEVDKAVDAELAEQMINFFDDQQA